MSYANAIRDIAPGSIWTSGEVMVTVACAAAGYVVARLAGKLDTLPVANFRAIFRPLYDREQVRQQFSMSLANLGEFRVYWLPEHRRILARSISCRRQFRVPDAAILVGTYGDPCEPAVLFRDLDELLAPHAPAAREAIA